MLLFQGTLIVFYSMKNTIGLSTAPMMSSPTVADGQHSTPGGPIHHRLGNHDEGLHRHMLDLLWGQAEGLANRKPTETTEW